MENLEEKKFDILLAQLQERYDALHKMRDRSMQFALWILGFGLGMAWLLINDTDLGLTQKITITCFLFTLGIVTFLFLSAIQQGFKNNHRVVIRIEKAMKLYEKDSYGISDSILPKEFSSDKCGWTGHFNTLYMLIITVFIALIVLTWTNPCKLKSTSSGFPTDPNQMQKQNVAIK